VAGADDKIVIGEGGRSSCKKKAWGESLYKLPEKKPGVCVDTAKMEGTYTRKTKKAVASSGIFARFVGLGGGISKGDTRSGFYEKGGRSKMSFSKPGNKRSDSIGVFVQGFRFEKKRGDPCTDL